MSDDRKPENKGPQESDFAQSTHDFFYRVWMRQTGGKVPFDKWKEERDEALEDEARASNPEFDPGDRCYYGDAQMYVLGLLTSSEIDASEWVKGEYVREMDPA